MSDQFPTPESFGREVVGPVFAEFCLRLWSVGTLLRQPEECALLFCARGGLRLQLGYETFLAASGLPATVRSVPLMVSRLVAVRSAVMRTVEEGLDTLVPAAVSTLAYEFPGASLAEVARVISGTGPDREERWADPFTGPGFARLLQHDDGAPVVQSLAEQADRFARHLQQALGGRRRAVLVDTGLFGTTAQLVGDAFPGLDVSSMLIARSNYRREHTPPHGRVFGLSVQADGYSPLHRRTALLRYWHFVEALFEPELESVRTFTEVAGELRSNLEVEGWEDRVASDPGTAYAGLLDYVAAVGPAPAATVLPDADRAWTRLHRAIVWPDRPHGQALRAGRRSYDFGSDVTFADVTDRGPFAALRRGSSMWREGEIARTGTRLRLPLLAGLEAAYTLRRLRQELVRPLRPRAG